jgi:formylglycine-generating enzyme required for sulfatase activity/energy-coupling factor transporter ATP-binding protein EcfA2
MDFQQTWRKQIQERLARFADSARAQFQHAAPNLLYGFLSAMALWPVAEAVQKGELAALLALGSVAGGVGANLIANQVQSWKDEADAAEQLSQAAQADPAVREALDALLDELDVIGQAQAGMSDQDRDWFRETLHREVAQLGSSLTVITVSGSGAAAVGERAVAAGEGGMAVGGDVVHGDKVDGDKVGGDRVVVSTHVRDVHGGTVITAGRDVTYTTGTGDDDPGALHRRYLTELAVEANRLPWASLDPDYADPSRGESLGLTDVYTALDTTQLERVESEDELRAFLACQAEARRIPAQEMINREAHLLLLGDPGSGKSTLVNFLAYVLAQAGRAEEPEPWLERLTPWDHGPLLPLRVILREFAAGLPEGTQRGKAALLLQHLRATLTEWGLDAFWSHLHQALGEGKQPILVLLDGLDEVPVELRKVVVESVDGFVGRYPRHRYLITCRPYAYVGQPWRLSGFREVTLAPFGEEQIEHFIAAWYNELARRGRFTKPEAKARAKQLKAAVARADLRGLAGRPLLLTVMALLHTFRGQLPEDRVELYRWTVDLLLRRWEGRGGDEQGVLETLALPGLKMSDLEAGLYDVAFRAHQGQGEAEDTADVDEADLRKWLAPYLENDWNKAGEFVDYIRERAGLLVRHKPAAYTFPHRTFQEFLAACHLTGHPDFPGEAARLAREDLDRWRVVYLLATGHAARTHRLGSALSAVNALCPEPCVPGEDVDDDAWRVAVLAGEALLEIGLVGVRREPMGQAVLKRTQGWLVALLGVGALDPRERAAAGDMLARLGDPRPGVGLRPDGLPDIVWCEVPAGSFIMGTREQDIPALMEKYGGEREWYGDETPQHQPNLPAYSISKYPVTNVQYAAFMDDGGYTEKWRQCWTEAGWRWKGNSTSPFFYSSIILFGLSNHPVATVAWYEAVAFCRWLTERLCETGEIRPDQEVTLPTEAQWEKAARGKDGRIFPWGDEFDVAKCNIADTDIPGIGTISISAVGMFPAGASPYNVEDLSGNVWEWCRTKWRGSYKEPADESLEGESLRVVRGGAYFNSRGAVCCASRLGWEPDHIGWYPGFRVCVVSQRD